MSLRIDKWLWFARFCKSRSLAQSWIEAGEVSVNGAIIDKSSQMVRIGDLIEMPRGKDFRHRVLVLDLAERRGPATDAALLYRSVEISKV
jgi:ribosome-associated heat shock protein Hsp15